MEHGSGWISRIKQQMELMLEFNMALKHGSLMRINSIWNFSSFTKKEGFGKNLNMS